MAEPVRLAFLRHASTAWNEDGRLQGRSDVALSPAGRAEIAAWAFPAELRAWRWASSPLARARETAALLRPDRPPEIAPALVEMSFGAWEGQRLAELRARHGVQFRENEAAGLDFSPPGGESPRAVMRRLAPWIAGVARAGEPTLAIAHKAVIRAVLAMATGWDMTGRAPVRLHWRAVHLFDAHADGSVAIRSLNLLLTPDGKPPAPAAEPGPAPAGTAS